jgi:urea-proton symporter
MKLLSEVQGYLLIIIVGLILTAITYLVSRNPRWSHTQSGFLKAGAKVNWIIGSFSIAAAWIWAPALFISVQKSYELGLPGIFWFTFPNILALVVYASLGPKIRSKIPGGYTLPDWIRYRFKDERIHKIYLGTFLWYQVMSVTVQVYVGGLMLSYLTGIQLNIVMILLGVIVLVYTLLAGLRGSMITDFIQMAMILTIGVIVIPWVISAAGGWGSVTKGIGGIANNTNIFDPTIAYSFGIVTSIGLIAGSINDQQYWQRSFAIDKDNLKKAFFWGGILFGIVPIGMSVLGFLAANPDLGITMPQGVQLPMIGIEVVSKLLPTWVTMLFVVMLLCGLNSTLDSGLCAGAALWSIDTMKTNEGEKEVLRKEKLGLELTEEENQIKTDLDKKIPKRAKQAMIGLLVVGLLVAMAVQYIPGFGLDKLWWVFNGIASMTVIPTVISLYWDRQSTKGVFLGFAFSFVGIIFFIVGNAINNNNMVIWSAIFIIVISTIMNFAFPSKEKFIS